MIIDEDITPIPRRGKRPGLYKRTIAIEVSLDQVERWKSFIASVRPSTRYPVSGDRILAAAARVIEREQPRQKERRDALVERKRLGDPNE